VAKDTIRETVKSNRRLSLVDRRGGQRKGSPTEGKRGSPLGRKGHWGLNSRTSIMRGSRREVQ